MATGRRTARRVASVAACGPEMSIGGGRVIFAGVQASRTVVLSAPLSLDRPPTRLGRAHAFVPSATEGRVWLAGVDCSRDEMVGVREVTVDGRVTVASPHRVPGSWVAGAVDDGLVILRGRAVFVWNPSAAGAGRRLGLEAVADTHGSRLVGCGEGSGCRDLAILDARTGETVPVRSSRRYRLDLGAEFSPDGALLAAPALTGRRWRLALVDARDGTHGIVPGSRTRAYPDLSWAASSGWLFFGGRAGRIMAYRPGAQRAVALPFRPPRRAVAFTAG